MSSLSPRSASADLASVSRTSAGADVNVPVSRTSAGTDLGVTARTLARANPEIITDLNIAARRLPVVDGLRPLVGAGLQRGTTLSVEGSGGAVSLAFNLLVEAARHGAWVAVLGGDWLGLSAIGETGMPLHQVVLVNSDSASSWLTVVAALLDGFEIVVVANPPKATHRDLRLLKARVRERNSILMRLGGPAWPESADLHCQVEGSEWFGVGDGHGYLHSRLVTVAVQQRRGAAHQRRHRVWLPDAEGQCRVEQATATPSVVRTVFAGSDIDQVIAAQDRHVEQAESVEGDPPRHLRRVV